MELTDIHREVLYGAFIVSGTGGGVANEDPGEFVACHELAEEGWLRRGFTDSGELGWFWTGQEIFLS